MMENNQENQTLSLTPKEELAVIVERLKLHEDQTKNQRAKIYLDLAIDLVRKSIYWRE